VNIQGTFSEHSVNIQGTFSEHAVNIQGTFREHGGVAVIVAAVAILVVLLLESC
jgi:hypothetical protein